MASRFIVGRIFLIPILSFGGQRERTLMTFNIHVALYSFSAVRGDSGPNDCHNLRKLKKRYVKFIYATILHVACR